MDIIFENRAVAYIDVLGFKSLVNNALDAQEDLIQLKSLISLLNSAVVVLNSRVDISVVPQELIPKHIYLSDCIILSAPLNSSLLGWERYIGIDIVVMRVIQIAHLLLKHGHILRGGIAVGLVWHSETNIVGPAYQEAYSLEQATKKPRIVLSPEAIMAWEKSTCASSRMCISYDDAFMVNVLHDYYLLSPLQGDTDSIYDKYHLISQMMIDSNISDGAKEKWQWVSDYIEDESTHAFP